MNRKFYFEVFKHLVLVNITLIGAISGSVIFNLKEISDFMSSMHGDSAEEEFFDFLKKNRIIYYFLFCRFLLHLVVCFFFLKINLSSS